MTTPLDRAYRELHEKDHQGWIDGLQANSPVSLMKVEVNVTTELYVDAIVNGVFVLSNGKQIPADGVSERSSNSMLIMIAPILEDRAAYLARRYRHELLSFNWRDLSVEQLEAVIKYAESKAAINEQMGKEIKDGKRPQ